MLIPVVDWTIRWRESAQVANIFDFGEKLGSF